MKVLGVVEWTTRDKGGSPIAGVRPLIELQKAEWREIDAAEEFPSQGQVFWPNALAAVEGSLITFRAEPNVGQKDEYRVVDPKLASEVLDLRSYGTPSDVHALLTSGLRRSGPIATGRALVWCQPDVLVGPIELTRVAGGAATLGGANRHRLPAYIGARVRVVMIDGFERLLRVDESAVNGYVDWDEDAVVLRRALEAVVRVAKQAGCDAGQTKRQIEDTARALASQGVGPDAMLDRYRLERAFTLLKDTELVARLAIEIADLLREHPAIKPALEEVAAKVREGVERSTRASVEQELARELAMLNEATQEQAHIRTQLEASRLELRNAEDGLTAIRTQAASAASEAEAAVDSRVMAALERPTALLAEVSVLRPLLGFRGSAPTRPSTAHAPARIDWSHSRGEGIHDKVSLRRTLTNAARARGVDPALMLQLHAVTAAGLMPVTVGPGALAALTSYAHGTCGARLHIIHVSPSFIQPRDFDDVPGGGLLAAAAAAKDIDGTSLVVFEGANRSPLEASLLPLLQVSELGLSPISDARGLRLTATLVVGATTVPVTSDLWSYAAAIYAEPGSPSPNSASTAGELALSSDLLALGDVPTEVVEGLIETWPDCRELRPALARFGSALIRLYDEPRIADALLHGLVLPYLATALSAEEEGEALRNAKADPAIATALHRLRRRLC